MSTYKSKTAIIDNAETQIGWNGIASITSNEGIEELYSFRDALVAIGSSEKRAVIEKTIALYESAHARQPTQDEAEEIGEESESEMSELDDAFYGCSEDLEALCIEYAKHHPEEVASLEQDKDESQCAAKILAAVTG